MSYQKQQQRTERLLPRLQSEEVEVLRHAKRQQVDIESNEEWRERLRRDLEADISRRVREALDTPPGERQRRNRELARLRAAAQKEEQLAQFRKAAHALAAATAAAAAATAAATDRSQRPAATTSDAAEQAATEAPTQQPRQHRHRRRFGDFPDDNSDFDEDEDSEESGSEARHLTTLARRPPQLSLPAFRLGAEAMRHFGDLTPDEKLRLFANFTRDGFREAVRTGRLPDGSPLILQPDGRYRDQFGVARDSRGPFWPRDFGPCHPTPSHRRLACPGPEPLLLPLKNPGSEPTVTFDTQRTQFSGRWRGTQIVFDSERSPRHYSPPTVPEDTCPSLVFESRFESGNLRQARRVGMFEYELVLRTDLYTKRHTQWFYFRVQNARPGIVYKFVIVNLLKSSSLYGEGMKPLCYSEKSARTRGLGWHRAGHHIRYSRNATRLQSALLQRDMAYYQLEWQMDFPHESDSCYLAHCYPYTYSDLRSDLAGLQRDQLRRRHAREEILCETRAGNACFLLTVTDPDVPDEGKHGVVVTARVHPGEANSSWMMKGLIDFLTGDGPEARELQKHFIFKIVPMLNPDGVIVGNYRTSLAGRDLNRNYRHPRKETFPTVYHTKAMLESFAKERPVALYCDLHGHSRKSHVFMYGCDSQYRDVEPVRVNAVRLRLQPKAFLNERLFPWLVSRCAPGLFSFHGCRFNIRRCKEATGRVVMWRQFDIANSFTMEATFSGTSVTEEDSRHFNTEDLETMGGSLASALWQYQQVKSDTTRQSQVVVDMTFDLVLNVLNERGVDVERQLSLVDKKTAEANQESANVPDADKESTMQLLKSALQDGRRAAPTPPGESSDARMRCLLDRLSLQTMGDCAGILRTLGIDGAEESDSSDSDSESEPEMPPEPPTAAEKRKRVGGAAAAQHRRDSKEAADAAEAGGSRTGSNQKKNWEEASSRVRIKQYPMFVNKYAGRSNHGIPCFSEERLLERANRRGSDGLKPAPLEERRAAAAAAVMNPATAGTLASLDELQRRLRRLLDSQQEDPSAGAPGPSAEAKLAPAAAESDRDRELDFMAQRMASAARPFHAAGLPPSKHLLRDRRQSDSNGRSGQSQKSRASIGGPWPAQGTTGQRSSAAAALTEQPAEFATAERSRPNRLPLIGDGHSRLL
ncbi:hypothetical protein BOX15_Mlig000412g2 [Macrostomum lignano]|uniref:Peptidase M14 domain-containing protein n=1 Tax=Macrostomum lignano TaxID=282301 RepID=A0A267EJ08_9PLAT|nr:hypothetical protein BOX15_Mlig000412g2 [Macrostomum lignano]